MENVIEYNNFFQIVVCDDEFGKRVEIQSTGDTEWHPQYGFLSRKEKIWGEILGLLDELGLEGEVFEYNSYRNTIRYESNVPKDLILLDAAKAKWAMRQVGRKKGRLS